MPVALADGALGLEALHTWTPPQGIISGGIPDLTLNDRAALSPLTSYAFILKSIGGLFSLPDITDERDSNLGRFGETVYDAQAGGKTVTYSGVIRATSLQKLREGANVLRRSFGAMSREGAPVHSRAQLGEGMMTITPHASYGSIEHVYFARASSLELGDEQTTQDYRRPFVLTLRMADPRVYEAVGNASEGHLDGASVFITNSGSQPTDPLFRLTGAFTTAPLVMARGTDYVLAFTNMNGIADALWVDFKSRRAWLDVADIDMTAHLSVSQSNWWDPGIQGLDPGPNDIGVTGVGVGGQWACFWQDAN